MIQQPDVNGLYWYIPGGVVEAGELIADTLRREIQEETGLRIEGEPRLAYVTQVDAVDYMARQTFAFVFDVDAFNGTLQPDDPDALIADAAFVPVAEAVQRLSRVIWDPMRDPLVTYLEGRAPLGSLWQYRQHSFRSFELIQW